MEDESSSAGVPLSVRFHPSHGDTEGRTLQLYDTTSFQTASISGAKMREALDLGPIMKGQSRKPQKPKAEQAHQGHIGRPAGGLPLSSGRETPFGL
jgi:hypothetical protein